MSDVENVRLEKSSNSVVKTIGILTSGGDAPGLNAAIRGVARTAINQYGIKVIGIEEGYRGLMQGLGCHHPGHLGHPG